MTADRQAHAMCTCDTPALGHEGYGRCARCDRYRPHGATPERIARARELAAVPHGERRVSSRPPVSP